MRPYCTSPSLSNKIRVADKATKILIPADNEDDYKRILSTLSEDEKNIYIDNFEIKIVEHYRDVINEVLVDNTLEFCFDN